MGDTAITPTVEGQSSQPAAFTQEALQGHDDSFIGVLEGVRQDHPYLSTVAETTATWIVRQSARTVAEGASGWRLGNGLGHSRIGEYLEDHPALATASALALAPLAEEALLRLLPSWVLDRQDRTGLQPAVGYTLAALFAAGHANNRAVPLSQFVGGLNYWRLMRSRGLSHAVLAHATHNVLCFGARHVKQPKFTT